MFSMRQSAELFGMMSHRFQIDESEIKERISSYDFSIIMDLRVKSLRTAEDFPGLIREPYNFGVSELEDINSN